MEWWEADDPRNGHRRPEGLKKQEPGADAVRLRGSGSVGARVRGCVWVCLLTCWLACWLARFLREGVGSRQRGRNRKSNTRREGFPFRRRRSRRQRRRLMGRWSSVVSQSLLAQVVGRGAQEKPTSPQAQKPKSPKARCDRSSNNSRLSWMGGFSRSVVRCGAVRCSAVQWEGGCSSRKLLM